MLMDSRVLPSSVLTDAPDEVNERLLHIELSDPILEGEKINLLSSEQNGALGRISSALGSGKREMISRSFHGSRPCCGDDSDLEDGDLPKRREKILHCCRPVKIPNQALLSGFAYCLSSCSMILINKYVLSGFDFNAGISLMLYQNFVSVVIVSFLSKLGLVSTEPLTWRLIRIWLPVNAIFVGMLVTSIFSLKFINVAMVTVLKNVANVMTAIGETYLFKKHHGIKVWTALFLMIISAISGGATDLSFHAVGYTWQILNCFLTAAYSAWMTTSARCSSRKCFDRNAIIWSVKKKDGSGALATLIIKINSIKGLHIRVQERSLDEDAFMLTKYMAGLHSDFAQSNGCR